MTILQMTGLDPASSSSTPLDSDETYPFRTLVTKEKIAYRENPPIAMPQKHIQGTIADYVLASRRAMEIRFYRIEINGGNGNCTLLPYTGGVASGNDDADAREFGDLIQRFVATLGLNSTLSRLGVSKDQVALICERIGAQHSKTMSFSTSEIEGISNLIESLF